MVFSNYMGAGGKISRFYLSSVLKAKLNENNLKDEIIAVVFLVAGILSAFITFSDYIPNASLDLTNSYIQVLTEILVSTLISIIFRILDLIRK